MRILISDALGRACVDILAGEGFDVVDAPGMPADRLLNEIDGFDGLVVRSATRVTGAVIERGRTLKVIGRAGTGVDNIDVDAATRRGVLVMNTPGGNTISTAEHSVSMLLALARNIPQAHLSVTRGEWEKKKFVGAEVYAKTAGVIGLGKVGREVALRLSAFGMTVLGYDPLLGPGGLEKLPVEVVSLDDLFRRSDFITVHTPLTAETRGLLNDRTIARCKKGVRLINCARGGIIDEAALLKALESGQVAGAALDVFVAEPPAGNPLLAHPRVIATPHLGASTEEAQDKVAVQIAEQIADALKGRGFSGVVNSSAVQYSMRADVRPSLRLAELMGRFVGQMIGGPLAPFAWSASGSVAAEQSEVLKAGFLTGLLSPLLSGPVNLISAPLLARERGVVLNEHADTEGDRFDHLLRVRYSAGGTTHEVAGAVFGTDTVRFVGLDGFRFDVRPEGTLLVYRNVDRPGILARVGSILAAHGVNIAGVALGRAAMGGNALTVMNIDGDIPEQALQELRALEAVTDLRVVALP